MVLICQTQCFSSLQMASSRKCIEEGWKEFSTYYSLRHGHVVVFKYRKTCSDLEVVHILDGGSSCEMNYPSHNTQNESRGTFLS